MKATTQATGSGRTTAYQAWPRTGALREHGEGDEQDVAGQHVGEEPDRQREGRTRNVETNSIGDHEDVAGPSARRAGTMACLK